MKTLLILFALASISRAENVEIAWDNPWLGPPKANIYVSQNNGPYIYAGSTRGNKYSIKVDTKNEYKVKVASHYATGEEFTEPLTIPKAPQMPKNMSLHQWIKVRIK